MNPLRRRGAVLFAAALVIFQSTAVSAALPKAAPQGLSEAAIETALSTMSAQERSVREASFNSTRYVIVAYNRAVQSFESGTGRPIGQQKQIKAGEVLPLAVTGITNLYISIAVEFDSQAPAWRWNITDYFDWTGSPPNVGAGKDQLTTAWANGLALHSDYAYGYYTNGTTVAMNRNDVSPNVGTSWEFLECTSQCIGYANWGYLLATIKETTLHNQATNVIFKYFHTWQNVNFSISFSQSGPSIGISPTANTTSTVVYTSFID
jgi:hypothetical protein